MGGSPWKQAVLIPSKQRAVRRERGKKRERGEHEGRELAAINHWLKETFSAKEKNASASEFCFVSFSLFSPCWPQDVGSRDAPAIP